MLPSWWTYVDLKSTLVFLKCHFVVIEKTYPTEQSTDRIGIGKGDLNRDLVGKPFFLHFYCVNESLYHVPRRDASKFRT